MQCPQCGTGLGEGAKACATCGWAASKKTLWIVLGCVVGFFLLVCCGAGTWFFLKAKKAAEGMQTELVPIQLGLLHAQIANYAQKKGKAPANLEEASAEPIVSKTGERVQVQIDTSRRSSDLWGHAFRYTANADRTFEVRSAGPNGKFDDNDDFVEKGTLDDDVSALVVDVETRTRKMGEGFLKVFGVDPEKLRERNNPPAPPSGGNPPAPPPPPAPPAPPAPPGGGK